MKENDLTPNFYDENTQVSARKKPDDPTINDIIMILETERLIFKTFNTMIAEQLK